MERLQKLIATDWIRLTSLGRKAKLNKAVLRLTIKQRVLATSVKLPIELKSMGEKSTSSVIAKKKPRC
jgi:hypothetical protein